MTKWVEHGNGICWEESTLLADAGLRHGVTGKSGGVSEGILTALIDHGYTGALARVASHPRSYRNGHFETLPEHMPAAHRAHAEWSPGKLQTWAASVGPSTAELVKRLLIEKKHPEQGYRACLGLMRLTRNHGQARMVRYHDMEFLVLPLYHPAAALYNGSMRGVLLDDFQGVKKLLK